MLLSNLKGQYSEGPRELCPNQMTAIQFDWLKIHIFRFRKAAGRADNRVSISMAAETCRSLKKRKGLIPTDSKLIANLLTTKLRVGRSLDGPYWTVHGWSVDGPLMVPMERSLDDFWMVLGWFRLDGPFGWSLDGESPILN